MNAVPQLNSLNKHQLEILKLFSRELDDNDLIEIKRLIVKYLDQKITKMADDIWEKNNWTDEDMERILKTHKRTPYNPNN
ncbi:MAG TPA: hypothetical protein PK198_10060 [Saprospiraceae bacterium]|nr:hypothetical protein [Saprospiraceae bacterium]HRK83978.1 hypothetical protein [Saprospiraceae bacterium]